MTSSADRRRTVGAGPPRPTPRPTWAAALWTVVLWTATLCTAILLTAPPARPCGPFVPPMLLAEDEALLEIPKNPFVAEVQRLGSLPAGRYPAVETHRPARLTAATGDEQLAEVLGFPPGVWKTDSRLSGYHQLRRQIEAHREALADWRYERTWRGPEDLPPRPELPAVHIPEGLPAEFELYLRGAIAWHRDDGEAARAAWNELLALPEPERRLRSVWAAFMLGRLDAGEHEAEHRPVSTGDDDRGKSDFGTSRFRHTRELAAAGFPDPLGLAQDSLGWEARAEWRRGRWDRALELYGEQLASGDRKAGDSLHRVCAAALVTGDEALETIAAARFPREVMTLYLAGHWDTAPAGVEAAAAWAERLERHGVDTVATAGLVAWATYQAARFDDAERWASMAAPGDPRARWVRAKLHLRQGRLAAAAELLDGLEGELWGVRARGEAGAIEVARGRYREAADRLLRSGYWLDAAYVAERLMTIDELQSYVDHTWPRELPDRSTFGVSGYGTAAPPDEWIAWRIRHLLARRLARAGRWRDAEPYYPGSSLPAAARRMAERLECGDDPACPADRRAEALWEAAKSLRGRGMALVGSELEPDFHAWSGNFPFGPTARRRAGLEVLPAGTEEQRRWQQSAIEPPHRYHYRFAAAELAWRAAELMPDQDPDTAWVLAVAGSWIQYLDPEAADRFYKALVNRCGETALGREADRRRWFPPLR